MTKYPKSRLPGPAVKLFDMGHACDDDTVRREFHSEQTIVSAPEVEWVLTEECRKD